MDHTAAAFLREHRRVASSSSSRSCADSCSPKRACVCVQVFFFFFFGRRVLSSRVRLLFRTRGRTRRLTLQPFQLSPLSRPCVLRRSSASSCRCCSSFPPCHPFACTRWGEKRNGHRCILPGSSRAPGLFTLTEGVGRWRGANINIFPRWSPGRRKQSREKQKRRQPGKQIPQDGPCSLHGDVACPAAFLKL